jgi:hypothetical protein
MDSTKEDIKWEKIALKQGYKFFGHGERRSKQLQILLEIASKLKISTVIELNKILTDAKKWGGEVLKRLFLLSKANDYIIHAIGFDIISFLIYYSKRHESGIIDIVDSVGYYYPAIRKAIKEVISEDVKK